MISLTDTQKFGVGLTGFGVFFLLFGVLLYFDRVLLGFGNILLVGGLPFIIGLQKTFRFFFQKQKVKGTSFFLAGVLLALLRWPVLGMVLETYGLFTLFKGFFPVISRILSNLPGLGFIFKLVSESDESKSLV
ncbi:vesicle transport protein GOT1A [Callorhinchus milii]|uniref:Golgi transport 1A n=1 Tax=Callorhinchus milii TaxID=7868 RepID=V9LAR9_CALMI|nr:vesicle transport protein GOT1A [Callorhinchus milii]|eukprot:gi/632963036/ref/XP_007897658.1/ PREDICTED: vesicle transport protein GOT1A [Callorhinchus milii]